MNLVDVRIAEEELAEVHMVEMCLADAVEEQRLCGLVRGVVCN